MQKSPRLLSSSLTTWRSSVVLGSICWLGLMIGIALQPFVSVSLITRDPAAIASHPPYFGALSNIGILLWSASAAVCYLSGILLKIVQPEQLQVRTFFYVFAIFSTLLCLDDTFLLHEEVLPNQLLVVRIPEKAVVAIYGLALLGVLVYFRQLLQRNQPWLFGFIFSLFAISVGFDQLPSLGLLSKDMTVLIEDGAKLLAIFLWLAYFVRASILLVATPLIAASPLVPDSKR